MVVSPSTMAPKALTLVLKQAIMHIKTIQGREVVNPFVKHRLNPRGFNQHIKTILHRAGVVFPPSAPFTQAFNTCIKPQNIVAKYGVVRTVSLPQLTKPNIGSEIIYVTYI